MDLTPSERPNNGHAELCRPHIADAGLPHRGEAILKRERNLYPLMIDKLAGRRTEKGPEDPAKSLTMPMLEQAFAARNGVTLPAAAFLAGRCEPETEQSRAKLSVLLREVLDSLPAANLDVMDKAYIEAAMSLALRGEPDAARAALLPLVTDYAASTSESYLAAFYLAQLGDPSGYPAIVEALHDESEHTRLMAVRHLFAFKPYEGQSVGGQRVDAGAELAQRLKDEDPYVRGEVPYYLLEAGVDGLEALLQPVAEKDSDAGVRQAAADALKRLTRARS